MPNDATALDLESDETVRVHADISRNAEMKLRLRCIQEQQRTGVKTTRKQYLEKLINDDVAKIAGASLREISTRRK